MILALTAAATALTAHCVATDGDSLRCGRERIRLLAIDAPEMGSCPPGRHCAPGDPVASRDNLRRLVRGAQLTIVRIKQDRYGRTIASVAANGVNLSCAQLRARHAIYRSDWDHKRRIGNSCAAARS